MPKGRRPPAFRGTLGFSGAELRYVQSGANTLVYDDADGDEAVDFAFTMVGPYSLTQDDFLL